MLYTEDYLLIFLSCRDYISPNILKMEYGLANVMEQYEKKYKARKLLGDLPATMPSDPNDRKANSLGVVFKMNVK